MASLGAYWDRFAALVDRWVLRPADLTPERVQPFLEAVPRFLVIIFLFYVLSRALVWTLHRSFLSPRRVDPMIGQLVGKLTFGVLMGIAFATALLAFGVNVFNLALTIGLIGAALALGLQNTVANIMGGIALASDRPFEVGDRVQIGEFWGDVEQIGLRSTRILTTRREYVIIPNRLMDEREIWNYTKEYPELRVDVGVQVSYDSDVKLAKVLALKAAHATPEVLEFPASRVLVKDLADHGITLELRAFIEDARARHFVTSDLRERIHRLYTDNGVEIPFPYRTVVEKKELPVPRKAEPEELLEISPLGPRRVLAATAGATPAIAKARTIAETARALQADLIVAYITPHRSVVTQREGERAAEIFAAAAQRAGVKVRLVVRTGKVVDQIATAAREEGCGAVLIGGSRPPVLLAWKNAEVEERLRAELDVPLIVVPPSLEIDPAEIAVAKAALDARVPLATMADEGEPS